MTVNYKRPSPGCSKRISYFNNHRVRVTIQEGKLNMFVDYSGLQRFSSINRCFAHQFIQFLKYESLDTIEEKLQFLKNFQKDEACIQRLVTIDFVNQSGVIDYLFKLSLSIKQMQEVSDVIRRCPTTYSVEIFNAVEANFDVGDVVAWAGMFLKNTYDTIRKSLCDDIKRLIIDLKPETSTSFQDWHLLQRYLFHGCCEELPKFLEPKTNIVIIPMDFPKLFMDRVNKNGFMDSNSNVTFYMFAVKEGKSNLLTNLNIDSLVLKPTEDKISTIWKDGIERNYIGTVSKPLARTNTNEDINSISGTAKSESTLPNFVTLFKSDIDPIYAVQDSSNPTSGGSSAKSETNSHSEKDGSIYDIFSPLSSKELPTALTPANNVTSPVQEKNFNYMANFEKEKPKDYAFLPPPPSFLPCYSDFETSSLCNQRQGFRHKLKQFCLSSHFHLRSRNCFYKEDSLTGFDTTVLGNLEDLRSCSWNSDDTSTRKFLKCKMRKWKNNCHYYREVAKQCIEEFHDSTISN